MKRYNLAVSDKTGEHIEWIRRHLASQPWKSKATTLEAIEYGLAVAVASLARQDVAEAEERLQAEREAVQARHLTDPPAIYQTAP